MCPQSQDRIDEFLSGEAYTWQAGNSLDRRQVISLN